MRVVLLHPRFDVRQEMDYLLLTSMRLLAESGLDIVLVTQEPHALDFRNVVLPEFFTLRDLRKRFINGPLRAFKKFLAEEPDTIIHETDAVPRMITLLTVRFWPIVKTYHTLKTFCPVGTRYLPHTRRACSRKCSLGCLAVHREEACMRSPEGRYLDIIDRIRTISELQGFHMVDPKINRIGVSNHLMKDLLIQHEYPEALIDVLPPPPMEMQAPSVDFPRNGPPALLYVGPLTRAKGVFDIIQAMLLMKSKPHLVIVGDGPERSLLERDVRTFDLTDRVTFRGNLWPLERQKAYEQAWVTVLPSISQEPIGMTAIESLAQGRPVVANKGVGLEDWLIPGQNGHLVSPRDIPDLAWALDDLLLNPDKARQMGLRGEWMVRDQYSRNHYVARLHAFYRQALLHFSENKAPNQT